MPPSSLPLNTHTAEVADTHSQSFAVYRRARISAPTPIAALALVDLIICLNRINIYRTLYVLIIVIANTITGDPKCEHFFSKNSETFRLCVKYKVYKFSSPHVRTPHIHGNVVDLEVHHARRHQRHHRRGGRPEAAPILHAERSVLVCVYREPISSEKYYSG